MSVKAGLSQFNYTTDLLCFICSVYVLDKGHVGKFAEVLSSEPTTPEQILLTKAAIWAVVSTDMLKHFLHNDGCC